MKDLISQYTNVIYDFFEGKMPLLIIHVSC
jgi:hypothetical protein